MHSVKVVDGNVDETLQKVIGYHPLIDDPRKEGRIIIPAHIYMPIYVLPIQIFDEHWSSTF